MEFMADPLPLFGAGFHDFLIISPFFIL